MPVVNFEQYKQMLKNASENHYAYPAFNISNMETVNAVLKGLAAAKSDGIIQVSTGGGAHTHRPLQTEQDRLFPHPAD